MSWKDDALKTMKDRGTATDSQVNQHAGPHKNRQKFKSNPDTKLQSELNKLRKGNG